MHSASLITLDFIVRFLSSGFQKSEVKSTFLITFWLTSFCVVLFQFTKGFHMLAALSTYLGNVAGREMLLKHKIH